MPLFFEMPKNISNKMTIDKYIESGISFNPQDQLHQALISDSIKALNDQLDTLQDLDKHVVLGFATAIAGFLTAYIFPVGIISGLGFGWATYHLAARSAAYKEYDLALHNLCDACQWTLGNLPKDPQYVNDIKKSDEIEQMITALAPLTSKVQLAGFIDDNYEAGFIQQSENVKAAKKERLFDRPLNQEERHVMYGIYGLKQGSVLNILHGLWYLAGQAFGYSSDMMQSYMNPSATLPTPK